MDSLFDTVPLIIAHSGCNGTAPNSLASIEAARMSGAEAIEFDVQSSSDGCPVLTHDPWITQGKSGRIAIDTLPGSEFIESPDHPALETVCDACLTAGLLLNLDIKDGAVLPAVYRILEERYALGRTFLTGCDLKTAQTAADPLRVGILINMISEVSSPSFPAVLAEVSRLGFLGVNLEYSLLSHRVIENVRAAGLSLGTWTVDSDQAINHVLSLHRSGASCDYLTSNVPDKLRGVYSSLGETI